MKKGPHLTPTFLLIIFAIAGSTWGVQRAHAATINTFTGSWNVSSGDFGIRDKQSISGLHWSIDPNFNGIFSFIPSISNYIDDQVCSPGFHDCENWSGAFSGGSVSFVAYQPQPPYHELFFTGTITDGSFSGGIGCDLTGECLGANDAAFSFASRWTNGWKSEGTLNNLGTCLGTCGQASFGTLSMTTITPEPGSLTLLGSGIVAVATFLRRRLRNSSPSCQEAQTRGGSRGVSAKSYEIPVSQSRRKCGVQFASRNERLG